MEFVRFLIEYLQMKQLKMYLDYIGQNFTPARIRVRKSVDACFQKESELLQLESVANEIFDNVINTTEHIVQPVRLSIGHNFKK